MENEDKKSNDGTKSLFLFLVGVLLVGGIFFFVKESNKKSAQDVPVLEEVYNSVLETSETPNLETEEGPVDMSNQKMTIEQKLATKAPSNMINVEKIYTATLRTNMGDIVILLDAKNRPQTVNNFVYLARAGFYSDVIFHRVISGFMIQSGDPLGTGTGGPSYKFADELSSPNLNVKGTIAMANAGSNTNGSQFFINLVDNNYLDIKHSVFGKITAGADVVEAIGKVKTGSNDKPVSSVVINAVEITEE